MTRKHSFMAALTLAVVGSTPLAAQQDDIYLLSPFEVSADEGGYEAQETQAAIRIQTNLQDLASALRYNSSPVVTLRKRADFITLRLHLVNDARLSDLRLTEIRATVHDILKNATRDGRITLQYPRGTITEDNFHVNPENIGNDTASFDVFLALPLGEGDKADKLTDELIAFAKNLPVEGRTLIEVGKPGLSVKNPERFREELLTAIAADLEKVRAAFGPDTRFRSLGFDSRMQVSAVTADEVELSLPYSFNIESQNFSER